MFSGGVLQVVPGESCIWVGGLAPDPDAIALQVTELLLRPSESKEIFVIFVVGQLVVVTTALQIGLPEESLFLTPLPGWVVAMTEPMRASHSAVALPVLGSLGETVTIATPLA